MAQGVRRNPLGNAGLSGCRLDRPLNIGFMHMVTPHFARCRHERQTLCGKEPLPDEFPRRRLRLLFERRRKKHSVIALLQVLLMESLDLSERSNQKVWKSAKGGVSAWVTKPTGPRPGS